MSANTGPTSNYDLPAVEREIAAIIGRSDAIRLSHRLLHIHGRMKPGCKQSLKPVFKRGRKAGTNGRYASLYVPQTNSPKFVELVGSVEHSVALVRHFGGIQIELFGCRSAIKRVQLTMAQRAVRSGATIREAADVAGLSDRNMRRMCSDIPRTSDTGDKAAALRDLYAVSWLLAQAPDSD